MAGGLVVASYSARATERAVAQSSPWQRAQHGLMWISAGLAILGAISVLHELMPQWMVLSLPLRGLVAAYRIAWDWVFSWFALAGDTASLSLPPVPEILRDVLVVLSLVFVALNYESMRHLGLPIPDLLLRELVTGLREGRTNWTGLLQTRLFSPLLVTRRVFRDDELASWFTPSGRVVVQLLGLSFLAFLIWIPLSAALVYGLLAYAVLLAAVPHVLPESMGWRAVLVVLVGLAGVAVVFLVVFALLLLEMVFSTALLACEWARGQGTGGRLRYGRAMDRFSWRFRRLWVLATSPALAGVLVVVAAINARHTVMVVLSSVIVLMLVNSVFLYALDDVLAAHAPGWWFALIEADPKGA